jgi:hypothetical protein
VVQKEFHPNPVRQFGLSADHKSGPKVFERDGVVAADSLDECTEQDGCDTDREDRPGT